MTAKKKEQDFIRLAPYSIRNTPNESHQLCNNYCGFPRSHRGFCVHPDTDPLENDT